jgi:excisionase family DNA binding protein
MNAALIAIFLPDGRVLALAPEALRAAVAAGAELGLGAVEAVPVPTSTTERWLTSEELQAATGIHSTTWEARAKSGEIPCLRVGKSLRFKLSEVEAAIRATNTNART